MNLGIIARADKTGLGNQTRNLVRMLDPFRIMIIDSTPFNKNEQHFDLYKGRNGFITKGFPSDNDVRRFLKGLDAVLTCETFYNPRLVEIAHSMGIRTYNQFNYEFLDNLNNPRMPLPTKLLSPSLWHFEETKERFGAVYLPPPTFASDYEHVRTANYALTGKPRFLHSAGRIAVNDRNGTLDLIKALAYTKSDFELVIKIQAGAKIEIADPRVTIEYTSPKDETELYKGFHAMILPRRYAGLCLPMNEALMSGLPVIMTDIEPNNLVLPKEWCCLTSYEGKFMTRTEIPLHSAFAEDLADKLDKLCYVIQNTDDYNKLRDQAVDIAMKNYSVEALKEKYDESLSGR